MKYFLAKTDPSTYSIEDLEKDMQTTWDGVHNPTAVLFLKQMQKGDRVVLYHSQGEASIVGLAEVAGNSRPDPNDAKTWLVDFKYLRTFVEPRITLKQIKATNKFNDIRLVRQGRLSTMDLPDKFVQYLKAQGLKL
jgi:predicted RNA-binding protein with PUA-like domain